MIKRLKIGNEGFTLIELLIVIAILGILAVIVFIAIDPTEKQAQARDTGRISSVVQLGRALQAYYTSSDGVYPDVSTWAQDLVDKGELSIFPSGIAYSANDVTNCTTYVQPEADRTYCYDEDQANGNGALVFAKAEANSHASKCTTPGDSAYFVFSTTDGRGGTICSASDPAPWASGTMTYED